MELCEAFLRKTNGSFLFIATTPIPNFRVQYGYKDMNNLYNFVLKSYESEENYMKAKEYILNAEIVIVGAAPKNILKERLKQKKITFKYTERIYKLKPKWYIIPASFFKYYCEYKRHKKMFLLSASAYAASDYAKSRTFVGKAYKWGYFPYSKKYENIELLQNQKQKNSLLWVGRLINWKHPEYAIAIAKKLKSDGYNFSLDIIGIGPMLEGLKKSIIKEELDDCVHLLGSVSSDDVRYYMEKSEVFMFTSDRQEGWGAVLNEAMNSACAVVANNSIGSVPYLLQHKNNGLICYNDENLSELYINVKFLLDNPREIKRMGKNAYNTIREEWNAEVAAERFLNLANELDKTGKSSAYLSGPCSKAND